MELDQDVMDLDSLLIESGATLRFLDGANRALNAHKIIVDGTLEIGTESSHFANVARVELTDGAQCTQSFALDAGGAAGPEASLTITDYHPVDEFNRTLLVRGGGVLDLHGIPRDSTWKFMRKDPVVPGDNRFKVVNAADWNPNDQIVIASTDFDMRQAEVHSIQAMLIMPGFDQIQLQTPVVNQHWAGRVGSSIAGYPDVYERAEVGLLTHNVKIYSPTPAPSARGDICLPEVGLAHDGAEIRLISDGVNPPTARIEFIEMWNAGKYDRMAHYPIHFHELGAVPGSYVKGASIRDSSNRAIVIHGSQQVRLENNVVYNIRGHAYYLERSQIVDTAYNTLTHNLGLMVHSCNPLDETIDSEGASVFYIQNARNVIINNAAAGADHSGFYYAPTTGARDVNGDSLDDYYLCGDDEIDYARTDHIALDEMRMDFANASYDATEYDLKNFRNGDSTVHCHGTFADNVAHSSPHGFWGHEHQNTMMRISDFTAYKNDLHAVMIKNKGITEVLGLMGSDNGNGLWLASHAYHMGYTPKAVLMDSHLIGQSANNISSPLGDPTLTIYGVQIYEGHNHIAKTYFEGFQVTGLRNAAAFGRHQRFPFYTNNPDNSITLVEVGPFSNEVYFENPAIGAAGETTVMIHDLDGSITNLPGAWIVPNHDFIVAGQTGASAPSTTYEGAWNAHVVDESMDAYGQLIVNWCDTHVSLDCEDNRGPSKTWDQRGRGAGVYGTIMGLEIKDKTECSGACTDILQAMHSNEGTHNRLGGNVLAGHDYSVNFYDAAGSVLPTADLNGISAVEVHLRYAATGMHLRVSLPLDREPSQVELYRGEESLSSHAMTRVGSYPTSATEWYYDPAVQRVYLFLDRSATEENASVLMLLP
jgi:cell migration-inducing and hyaluronan-binding protein